MYVTDLLESVKGCYVRQVVKDGRSKLLEMLIERYGRWEDVE